MYNKVIDKKIGENLQQLRKMYGISATELYEMTGIKSWSVKSIKSAISRIELGNSPMTANMAVSITNALGVPVNDIFTGIEKCAPGMLKDNLLTDDEIEVVNVYRGLTIMERKQIEDYIGYIQSQHKHSH